MATNTPITIDLAEELPPALDFTYLKTEGLEWIQQLSGDIWTDFNESDPGVTNLEQLCYALTELAFRARISLADLLVDPSTGKTDPHRQALFPARRILPCNPVTEDDYRKLLVDRVSELSNVWLEPYRGAGSSNAEAGLYEVWAYVPGAPDPECFPDDNDRLLNEIWRVYNHHRDLCEDLRSVHILRPVPARVFAEVIVESQADANDVLARVLFALGQLFAPELRREQLKSLIDRGETSSQIFDGPLLLNGFIDVSQLQNKAAEIAVQDVVSTLTRTSGVAGASGVRVRVRRQDYDGDQQIPVAMDEILLLDPNQRDGSFTLRLSRDGQQIEPDAQRVERQLSKLQADQRRSYRLADSYDEYFSFPEGRVRDLSEYESIQNQYPNVYGISSYGLPADSSSQRRGQAKQLKGYLLAFEQLLADYFSQLAHVRDLFSISELPHTYFFQYLNPSVPDVDPLLRQGDEDEPGYRRGLPQLVHAQDPVLERHGRFLDLLLALYAESLDTSSLFQRTCDGDNGDDLTERLILAKRTLLGQLVTSTRDRGRAFDYMDLPSRRNRAGMEIKIRVQLGMDRRPLGEVLDELSLELVADDGQASFGRPLRRHGDYIEDNFEALEPSALPEDEADADRSITALDLAWQPVTDGLISAASSIDNFRIGSFEGDRQMALVCRGSSADDWRWVGKFADVGAATSFAVDLSGRLSTLQQHCSQLYLVEHNLLRFGDEESAGEAVTAGEAVGAGAADFTYKFTLSVVLSTCSSLADDEEYQRFVAEVVRQNTPAHIAAELCFLSPHRMCTFEDRYRSWRRALRVWSRSRRQRGEEWRSLVSASRALRQFLQRHCGACRGASR